MTKQEIEMHADRLAKAYTAANNAENAYRLAKAQKFLQLSCPPAGEKKPTEAVILSTIDADPAINALRMEYQARQADLDVEKMTFKALSSAN